MQVLLGGAPRLIALDMDGTLLNSDKRISQVFFRISFIWMDVMDSNSIMDRRIKMLLHFGRVKELILC